MLPELGHQNRGNSNNNNNDNDTTTRIIILILASCMIVIIAYISINKFGATHQSSFTEKKDKKVLNTTVNKERCVFSYELANLHLNI